MIPRILELKNFLSYGEQVQRVDFKNYALICLSGKNGNGKSALLDAITWALWGQARKIVGAAKADDGLLRLGQTRMMVSLTFDLGTSTYRVRREFAKTLSKPYAALDFEIFDATKDAFISLTDKTIRTTQAKVEHLIGLDYETFINSAFLRQGQSNEFSKKSSKDRKQLLANILGLSKYDKLQHQAYEKVKILTDEKKGIAAILEQYAQEIAKEPHLAQNLKQEKESLQVINGRLQEAETIRKKLEKELLICQSEKNNLDVLKTDLTEKQKVYNLGIQNLQMSVREWKQVHRTALTLPDISILQNEKIRLFNEEKQILESQRLHVTLQEKILHLNNDQQKRSALLKSEWDTTINNQHLIVQKQELALKHHQTVINNQQQTITTHMLKLDQLHKEKMSLQQDLDRHATYNKQLVALKTRFEKGRALYQSLVQRGNWTKNALTDLQHKQKVIHDQNPACPLCEQLLTVKRKQFLAQQLEHDEKFLNYRCARISTLLKKLKDLLVIQHDQIQILTKETEAHAKKMLLLEEVTKTIKQTTQDLATHQQEQQRLITDTKILEITLYESKTLLAQHQQHAQEILLNDPEIQNIIMQRNQLEKEKSTQSYDQQMYQQLQERMALVDKKIDQYYHVKQSFDQQRERKNYIHKQCLVLKELKKTFHQMHEKLSTYDAIQAQEITLKQDIANIDVTEMFAKKEHALHTIGSLEYALNHITKLKEEVSKKNKTIADLNGEIEDYQALATALSKNGIQALLIEEIIPEIEQEANLLLSRLTNNQAQIFIESLRDLKNGGVKETLDIQIADAAGIRPYEMYSGGEAFRVDFALRIAISKLLARRSGSALQTLIIDEGFGSQDEDGLSHIMDALYAIQSDFSKIIIVSHLPEFKHNFPVHFIAEKGPSGTVIHIEERG